jgi:hypothetical protein
MVGRFFRLGTPASASVLPSGFTPPTGQSYDIYQLEPGSDISTADAAANSWTAGGSSPVINGNVWLIGAAPTADSNNPPGYSGPYTGPNQDIGVATGFIRLNLSKN